MSEELRPCWVMGIDITHDFGQEPAEWLELSFHTWGLETVYQGAHILRSVAILELPSGDIVFALPRDVHFSKPMGATK